MAGVREVHGRVREVVLTSGVFGCMPQLRSGVLTTRLCVGLRCISMKVLDSPADPACLSVFLLFLSREIFSRSNRFLKKDLTKKKLKFHHFFESCHV